MGRRRLRIAVVFFGAAWFLLVSGCASREAEPEYIYGAAQVQSIEVRVDHGMSSRATAIVRGIVRDSCTLIAEPFKQSLDGKVFFLTLTWRRAIAAEGCREVDFAFEATVPLVVRGLQPGEYTVTSNNVSTTFTFQQAEAAPQL